MPDDRLGEIPVAVVEPKPGRQLEESAILDFAEPCPDTKASKIIFDRVPHSPTSKIEKPVVREKLRKIHKCIYIINKRTVKSSPFI